MLALKCYRKIEQIINFYEIYAYNLQQLTAFPLIKEYVNLILRTANNEI